MSRRRSIASTASTGGLGRLIGVRERDLPESWAEFREYFDRMINTELVAHRVG